VVDSGSTDGSVASHAVAEPSCMRFRARVQPRRSRNLGASIADGELLVFISQDAYPADEHWLERLTHPLREEADVAGVYGRQLPHAGARRRSATSWTFCMALSRVSSGAGRRS